MIDYDTLVKKVKVLETQTRNIKWAIFYLVIAVIVLSALMTWQLIFIISPIIDGMNMLAENQMGLAHNQMQLAEIFINSGICEVVVT